MHKKLLIMLLAITAFGISGCYTKVDVRPTVPSVSTLSEAEARSIAENTCIKGGGALATGVYNESSKTWWFDANLNATQPGCNPACVVSVETRTASINWRCTGAIPPASAIVDFTTCVAAGNPVMESYPRKCSSDGKTYTEQIPASVKEIYCTPESRKAAFCTTDYLPVCGKVNIQCIKAPCYPIQETFSNACEACKNALVPSYTNGACDDKTTNK